MGVIKWRDTYNTGIESIDSEHRQLVDLIDKMYCAVRDQATQEAVMDILNELVTYTQNHFTSEEEIMQANNYPKLAEHSAEHKKLIDQVEDFKSKVLDNFPKEAQEFYLFLREWLVEHILHQDIEFGKFHASQQ